MYCGDSQSRAPTRPSRPPLGVQHAPRSHVTADRPVGLRPGPRRHRPRIEEWRPRVARAASRSPCSASRPSFPAAVGTPLTAAMLSWPSGSLVGPRCSSGIDVSAARAGTGPHAGRDDARARARSRRVADRRKQLRRDGRCAGCGCWASACRSTMARRAPPPPCSACSSVGEAMILGVVPRADRCGARSGSRHRASASAADPPGSTSRTGSTTGSACRCCSPRSRRPNIESEISGGRSTGTLMLEELGYGASAASSPGC